MDRRELLRAVAVFTGVAVSPGVASAILGAAPVASGAPLAGADLDLAGLLADHVIPETDTPGAVAAGVPDYISSIIESFMSAEDADRYRDGLSAFERAVMAERGTPFATLDRDAQVEWLSALDDRAFDGADDPLAVFWRDHKALTVAGYYSSEIGATQELRRNPMGVFEGDVPFDSIGRSWS